MHAKVLLFLWTIDLDLLDVIVFCYAHDKIYAIFGKKLCQNFDICQCTMVTKESNKNTVRFIALSRLILRSYHMFINDRMIYNLCKKCKFASSYLFICKEVIFTQKSEGKCFNFTMYTWRDTLKKF